LIKKTVILTLFLFGISSGYILGNVSDYTFSQEIGTFNSIHTTGTYIAAGCTSTCFGNLPIGFSFIYNGTAYSQFGLCCSGWISMGAAIPLPSFAPISSGSTNNIISPFGSQLTSTVAGDGIYYKTEGTAPNRILTVEWWQYGFWLNGFDEISFQIKLYETSNTVRFVYVTNDEYSIRTVQVGLRGNTNADFNNRQTTTNWSQTTAGTANNSTCSFQPGITPEAGLTFIFTPQPVGIIKINSAVPESYSLMQNYPIPLTRQQRFGFHCLQHHIPSWLFITYLVLKSQNFLTVNYSREYMKLNGMPKSMHQEYIFIN
jgi:hypothetical protein